MNTIDRDFLMSLKIYKITMNNCIHWTLTWRHMQCGFVSSNSLATHNSPQTRWYYYHLHFIDEETIIRADHTALKWQRWDSHGRLSAPS